MTEEIHFDSNGLRDAFYIEILEFSRTKDDPDYYAKFAYYDTRDGLTLLRNFTDFEAQTTQNMQTKIFKVIMHEGMPFLRIK